MNGIDFTKQVLPPDISLENNKLTIKSSSQQSLHFRKFNYDFTLNQFNSANVGYNGQHTNFGWKLVHVRVPKSLKIDNSKHEVQFITNNYPGGDKGDLQPDVEKQSNKEDLTKGDI